MRTITAEQRQRIEDLSAQGLHSLLPSIAEKDIHVTDLLKDFLLILHRRGSLGPKMGRHGLVLIA